MTRILLFTLLTAGVLSASASRADVPVAPPPCAIHADGSRDPVPQPVVAKKEDPREVVDRIIKNSKEVGDKLAKTDTGTDTQKTQSTILKDIDALLNQDDPPPQSDKDKDKDKDKDMKDMNDKKDMNMPMGGGMSDKKMDMMPMSGMGGMGEQPMGGDQPQQRRPRQQGSDPKDQQPKDPGMNGGGGGQQKNQPMGGKPNDSRGGKLPDPHGDKNPPPTRPLFPNEQDVVKDVWGHLPDKLRQQATQYYKEEFMPRYAKLLKQYYSSMSDKK